MLISIGFNVTYIANLLYSFKLKYLYSWEGKTTEIFNSKLNKFSKL